VDCPKCKLINEPGALVCDCGYDFETKKMQPLALQQQRKSARYHTAVGAFRLLGGILFTLAFSRSGNTAKV